MDTMTTEQADLLREAVHRAYKEVQNANLDDYVSTAGTWNQGDWGSADVSAVKNWDTDVLHGFRVSPQPMLTCGTTGCIAGHICTIGGGRLLVTEEEYEDARKYGRGEAIGVTHVVTPSGGVADIEGYAVDLLGGGRMVHYDDNGNDLFSGSNSMAEVIEIADNILTDHGHAPTGLGE